MRLLGAIAQRRAESRLGCASRRGLEAGLVIRAYLATYGTEGRGVQGKVCSTAVAGSRPSELAFSLNSPASRVDCTMTCARPLNRLRDHGAAVACPTIFTVTFGFKPPWYAMLFTPTAMTLSPAWMNFLMSKIGCACQSCDSPTNWPFTKYQPSSSAPPKQACAPEPFKSSSVSVKCAR